MGCNQVSDESYRAVSESTESHLEGIVTFFMKRQERRTTGKTTDPGLKDRWTMAGNRGAAPAILEHRKCHHCET
jgi:hypothetical protein